MVKLGVSDLDGTLLTGGGGIRSVNQLPSGGASGGTKSTDKKQMIPRQIQNKPERKIDNQMVI